MGIFRRGQDARDLRRISCAGKKHADPLLCKNAMASFQMNALSSVSSQRDVIEKSRREMLVEMKLATKRHMPRGFYVTRR